jgi:hypothetical protein
VGKDGTIGKKKVWQSKFHFEHLEGKLLVTRGGRKARIGRFDRGENRFTVRIAGADWITSKSDVELLGCSIFDSLERLNHFRAQQFGVLVLDIDHSYPFSSEEGNFNEGE